MPPKIQELLQDKRLLAIIGGGAALLILALVLFMNFAGGKGGGDSEGDKELTVAQRKLAEINSIGKAIEIQALLARQGIHLEQESEGEKITLKFGEKAKQKDRDRALITLVQSGLMDKNVGLEAFDKGDLTASREEKRIKLVRSQQGELVRLIKKIEPIEDASVNIAIPEQTLFRSDEKPMTASVQVSLPIGTRLSKDKVRAITNLVVGSLQGMDAAHVSISDTNGATYNSILDLGSDLNDKLEEQDSYMRQKVATQLDRLVGPGNYVVTVSTELRQSPKETMVQEYPQKSSVVSSQQYFDENLNTQNGPGAGGPASSFLPNALASMSASGGTPGKDYRRHGTEVAYNNSKTQWVESSPVGMTESISIAVTIDAKHFPQDLSRDDLKSLLAKAASPKVRPDDVSIVPSDMQSSDPLAHTDTPEPPADITWLFWAGGTVLVCILLIVLLSMGNHKAKSSEGPSEETFMRTQQELQQLKELATQQQIQLQATQQQTQILLEAQQRQMEQAQNLAHSDTQPTHQLPTTGGGLQQTLEELRQAVATTDDAEDDEMDLDIKSWIESS